MDATQAAAGDAGPSFVEYVDGLAKLLKHREPIAVRAALDGQVATELRARVPILSRRKAGAFFTGHVLSQRLARCVNPDRAPATVLDPACGAGDLLLAATRRMESAKTVTATLRRWGKHLHGRDLDESFVRAARIRVALIAAIRCSQWELIDEDQLKALLPGIMVGDGRDYIPTVPVTVMMNPPFGETQVNLTAWGGVGRLSRAASFTADIVARLAEGSWVYVILPDVLRSGSRYESWRRHIDDRLRVTQVTSVGQFDEYTDVDVFILGGRKRTRNTARRSRLWGISSTGSPTTVGDAFTVSVGTVVPHRDPHAGDESPYICARDLPTVGQHHAGAAQRRHKGRRFAPPFVAVRRTSRPTTDGTPRIIANVVTADEPVLVENHLLICQPNEDSIEACRVLVAQLRGVEATAWLNDRIRCRHLTVSSLRDVPLRARSFSESA